MSHLIKFKTKTYHTVGKVPNSNRKIIERDKSDTPSTQIYYYSRDGIGTGTSITTGEVRLLL